MLKAAIPKHATKSAKASDFIHQVQHFAFVVIDTVLFVNQMKFGRISSAHCYGSILGRVVVGLLSFCVNL